MKRDTFVASIPEQNKDLVSSILLMRSEMPQEIRKYMIGPIVGTDKFRTFVLIDPGANCGNNTWHLIVSYFNRIRSLMVADKNSSFIHVSCGDGKTIIKHTSDEHSLSKDMEKLLDEKRYLEGVNIALKNQLKDAIALRDKETVVAEGIKTLYSLRENREIVDRIIVLRKRKKLGQTIDLEEISELL